MFAWTMIHSLMVLEDPQIHSEFFPLSISLSQLPCVFASKGLHWDPRLLKLACMQHREPEVTGVTCRWWSCVGVWKTSSLAHSSILAWKIPWTEEHGRLQPMGSQRVRHDWATSFSFLLVSLCPGTRSITSPITTYCISVFMSVSPLDFKYFEDKVLWFFCVSSSL